MSTVGSIDPTWFKAAFTALGDNVSRVIQGKREVIDFCLVALLAEGHLLLEDDPGTGKTTLARALAASIGGNWSRIQFTPDLLPSDVTGVSIWNQRDADFEWRPGPVFTNILIGDEINRASPKTQAALLEVMEERQVTNDGKRREVEGPFMVIATQNPLGHQGTYQLPESQLDRFLMRLKIGYPDPIAEMRVIDLMLDGVSTDTLPSVISVVEARLMIGVARRVAVAAALKAYVVDLATATRRSPDIRLGASPRASVSLVRAAQVRAASQGRGHVEPPDVKDVAVAVLAHRIHRSAEATVSGRSTIEILEAIVDRVPVPTKRLVG